jgi:hypothetical protein
MEKVVLIGKNVKKFVDSLKSDTKKAVETVKKDSSIKVAEVIFPVFSLCHITWSNIFNLIYFLKS